jgi:hypothetical protein
MESGLVCLCELTGRTCKDRTAEAQPRPNGGHNHQEAFDMEYKHTNFWGSLFVSPAQILYRAFVLLLKTI